MAKKQKLKDEMVVVGDDLPPSLEEVVTLAQQQALYERHVAEAETALALAKARLRQVAEVDLPEAMREAGLAKMTLKDGTKIEVKKDFQVGIAVERRPEAYAWLEKHGYGALIKTEVGVAFGKGDLPKAQKLLAELIRKKFPAQLQRDVHWQTLKAFVRETLADEKKAKTFPMELFGAIAVNKATVKLPKQQQSN